MYDNFTPDGIIVMCLIAVGVLFTFLWILIKARLNGGIARIPSILMFGWDGAAWGPNIIVINRDYYNQKPLIAHEQCHQAQQRRDGVFTFYFRYFTSKEWRYTYELEAYRVWVRIAPEDINNIARVLVHSYGFDLTYDEALAALK